MSLHIHVSQVNGASIFFCMFVDAVGTEKCNLRDSHTPYPSFPKGREVFPGQLKDSGPGLVDLMLGAEPIVAQRVLCVLVSECGRHKIIINGLLTVELSPPLAIG